MKKMLPALLLLAACGDSESDVAADAAYAAGRTVAALAVGAHTGADASAAQDDDAEIPKAPATVPSCATISNAESGLRVDFGTGCRIGAQTYSGSYTIVLSVFPGAMLSVVFDDLGVDGTIYAGDTSLALAPGTVDTNLDLTIDGATIVQLDGALLASNEALTFDGSGRYADGTLDVTVAANGLHSEVGQCYADAGTIVVVQQGLPTATVTFDANTPSTGVVTVTVGTLSVRQTLPPIADCPR